MLHPDHWSDKYFEEVKRLQAQGFRSPKRRELPDSLPVESAYTFLVNGEGRIKSVDQGTGEVRDWADKAQISEA